MASLFTPLTDPHFTVFALGWTMRPGCPAWAVAIQHAGRSPVVHALDGPTVSALLAYPSVLFREDHWVDPLVAFSETDPVPASHAWAALTRLVQRHLVPGAPALLCGYEMGRLKPSLPPAALWPCPVADLQVLAAAWHCTPPSALTDPRVPATTQARTLLAFWHDILQPAAPVTARLYDVIRQGAWDALSNSSG